MEENLQKDNSEEQSSYFLKRKWWRPLYYVYFVAAFVGVVLIYSARNKGPEKNAAGSTPAVQHAGNSAATAQVATTQKENAAPSQTEKKSSAPEHRTEAKPAAPKKTSGESNELAYMMSPSDKTVDKGKTLFMNNCVACHGANGEGDGPAAAALKPKPRDFHSAKGWINGRMASGMFKTLTQGIPGSPMPPFSSLSVKDRLAIISYIRTFKGFPKETKSDIKQLSKMVHESGGSGQAND